MLIVIMGKSATGKDTITDRLIKDYALERVVTATTRPMRTGEIEGVTYYFKTEEQWQELNSVNGFVEQRVYYPDTLCWRYGTPLSSIVDTDSNKNYVIVLTPEGFYNIEKYMKNVKNAKHVIKPVYITVPEDKRMERARKRESRMEHPDYEELERRLASDSAQFTSSILADMQNRGCVYINDNIDEVVARIYNDLIVQP